MIYLVDTNVLLRYADPRAALCPLLQAAAMRLQADGHTLSTAAQNLIEFWNVATRPVTANGLGLGATDAEQLLSSVEQVFPLLGDSITVYEEWRRIVIGFGVCGVKVHDARLVATMRVHGINHILTLNTQDFGRYASLGIVAVDPISI